MAKVLQARANASYVDGIRGAHSGVRLARDPEDIRIGDVVRALDSWQSLECFGAENGNCVLLPHCRLKRMFATAQQGFLRELDRITLCARLDKTQKRKER